MTTGSHSITVVDSQTGNNGPSGPTSGHHANQRMPCDLVVYDMLFELSSPGYPYSYPLNADCLYSVRRLSDQVCKLRLTIVEFDLESSKNCETDSLSIGGHAMCGQLLNQTVKEVDFSTYKIPIRFRSDGFGTKRGFFIKGHQVVDDCRPSPFSPGHSGQGQGGHASQALYSPSAATSIHVPDNSQYSSVSNKRHSFTARPPPLQPKPDLYPPYAPQSIYPGVSAAPQSPPDKPIGDHFSSIVLLPVDSPSNRHELSSKPFSVSTLTQHGQHGQSPSSSQFGYGASASASTATPNCHREVNETFFDLRSPNYPVRYPSNVRCVFTILKNSPSVCHIDLLFGSFDVGESSCQGVSPNL